MERQSGEGTARIIDTFKKAAAIADVKGWQPKGRFVGRECIAGKIC